MNEYSKKYTNGYINNIIEDNVNKLCFLYLESKAFKDKVITHLSNRWSEMTHQEIINDLLLTEHYDIYPLKPTTKFTTLYSICESGNINIVPFEIIKNIPISAWNERILDNKNSTDMTKFQIKTLKEFLLSKRKTPTNVKEYLLSV
jgi:hypothetical protein